jgi:1-acyl-sn-glycerol-3-phosphate acyltransferase
VTDQPAEAHAGVAFIAMRAGTPVVPVGIAGTELALPKGAAFPRFPRVTIRYGEPVRPEDFTEGSRKERMQAMTAEIMRRIAAARAAAQEE